MKGTWDLSILYTGFDDPAFAEDKGQLDAAIGELVKLAGRQQGVFSYPNRATVKAATSNEVAASLFIAEMCTAFERCILGLIGQIDLRDRGLRVWHHRRCIFLRLDSIRDFVAIPYRNKLRISYTPAA